MHTVLRPSVKRSVWSTLTILVLLALTLSCSSANRQPEPGSEIQPGALSGAGSTFVYPLLSQWAHEYSQLYRVQVNYQSIGSGGGIAQIRAKTVDFGASDAPLTAQELEADGLFQFPIIIGGVVPVVNLEGIQPGQLKLSRQLIADIFLGKVKRWDDPQIKQLNPGLNLPSQQITVVRRADGSGTSWIFTSYLSAISKEWQEKVGTGKAVNWPVGIGGKGNEGVSAYVQRVAGSIGYVEYAYAVQNNLCYTLLENGAGNYVAPSVETFQAAAANADWKSAPGFYLVLTDQPGDNSWPITGATFILIHKEQQDCAKAQRLLQFFEWCLDHGDQIALNLHYVPLPENVVTLIRDAWSKEIRCQGQPVATTE